jgi:hypothetical protein
MTRERPRPFSANYRNRLRDILITGTDEDPSQYEALLPLLEDAARNYPHLHINPSKTIAREHLRDARQCEQAIRRFARTVNSIERRHGWDGYVDVDTPSLYSIAAFLAKPDREWRTWNETTRMLAKLLADTSDWVQGARVAARKRRGSGESTEKRFRLAHLVAFHMAAVGIRLTLSENGQLAGTLKIVYSAAGEEVPDYLFRDVQQAIQRLTASHPHLVQPRRRSTARKVSQTRA